MTCRIPLDDLKKSLMEVGRVSGRQDGVVDADSVVTAADKAHGQPALKHYGYNIQSNHIPTVSENNQCISIIDSSVKKNYSNTIWIHNTTKQGIQCT